MSIKGTFYIISSLVGKQDRLTLGDIKDIYNNGWDICNHTAHHVNFTKIGTKEAYDEIYGCSARLLGHDFMRDMGYKHFAYSNGAYSNIIIAIISTAFSLRKSGKLISETSENVPVISSMNIFS